MQPSQSEKPSKIAIFTLNAFSQHMILAMMVTFPTLWLIEWISQFSVVLCIELYITMFLLSWIYLTGSSIDMYQMSRGRQEVVGFYHLPSGYQNHTAITLAAVITLSLAHLIVIGQISRHLHLTVGGFCTNHTEYWYWVRFAIDCMLTSLPFDIDSHLNLKLSDIKPNAPWSHALTIAFKALISAYMLVSLFSTYKAVQVTWRNKDSKLGYFEFGGPSKIRWVVKAARDDGSFAGNRAFYIRQILIAMVWLLPIILGLYAVIRNPSLERLAVNWEPISAMLPFFCGVYLICKAIIYLFYSNSGSPIIYYWNFGIIIYDLIFGSTVIYAFFWAPFAGLYTFAILWLIGYIGLKASMLFRVILADLSAIFKDRAFY